MKYKSEFQIRICSDLDYEQIVADICYQGKTIAIVSQEKGVGSVEIEFLPADKDTPRNFPLDDFQESLQIAKEKFIQMQKLPD